MFQHLNHNDSWPRVRRFGLEVDPDTGALSLRKLPGPPKSICRVPGPPVTGPQTAGMAVGSDGTIYLSDPATHRVFLYPRGGCPEPLSCVGSAGPGREVG